jgi:hypothetical protein
MSLTRRRETAKWEKASLLRVFVFDSDIRGAARPEDSKKGREEEDSEITLLCAFASSREARFSSPDAIGGSMPDAAERPTTKSVSISNFLILPQRFQGTVSFQAARDWR